MNNTTLDATDPRYPEIYGTIARQVYPYLGQDWAWLTTEPRFRDALRESSDAAFAAAVELRHDREEDRVIDTVEDVHRTIARLDQQPTKGTP